MFLLRPRNDASVGVGQVGVGSGILIIKQPLCRKKSTSASATLLRSCHHVLLTLASNPGAEEVEKSAWYPLFAHALNFPTFRESRIRLRHSRGLLTSDACT